MEFKNEDRYRQSYNAGPMRFLPVAYNPKGANKALRKSDRKEEEGGNDEKDGGKEEEEEKVAKQDGEDKSTCEIVIEAMQWGLYRPGSTDLVINGRFEELVDKPMFRGLLEKKRCVVCNQTIQSFYIAHSQWVL